MMVQGTFSSISAHSSVQDSILCREGQKVSFELATERGKTSAVHIQTA